MSSNYSYQLWGDDLEIKVTDRLYFAQKRVMIRIEQLVDEISSSHKIPKDKVEEIIYKYVRGKVESCQAKQ